jgi:hypothetical protein
MKLRVYLAKTVFETDFHEIGKRGSEVSVVTARGGRADVLSPPPLPSAAGPAQRLYLL